jgi:hypothetical protein
MTFKDPLFQPRGVPPTGDIPETAKRNRLLDRFFAASRAKLREIAERIGVRQLINLTGCPIR